MREAGGICRGPGSWATTNEPEPPASNAMRISGTHRTEYLVVAGKVNLVCSNKSSLLKIIESTAKHGVARIDVSLQPHPDAPAVALSGATPGFA